MRGTLLRSALLAATLSSIGAAGSEGKTRIALNQHGNAANPTDQVARFASNRRAPGVPTQPITEDGGFWYGTFDVGDAQNLSLLIDTGSSDVGINPARYQPSPASVNLHRSGVFVYGTVFEDGCGLSNISYHVYSDRVSQDKLLANDQRLYHIVKKPQPNSGTITKLPHDGIVGFSGNTSADTALGGEPFFQSLCNQHQVDQCRFGLALGTEGVGQQILGGTDDSLFEGKLQVVNTEEQWLGKTNVVAGNTVLFPNVSLLFDSGTAGIIGPVSEVKTLFKKLGIQAVEQNLVGCTGAVFGYYPCDSPPSMGYQFGDGPAFNVEPSAIQLADNGNNNCTAFITGIDFGGSIAWIAGQAWFQGKYLDFDQTTGEIGIAQLKDKTCP